MACGRSHGRPWFWHLLRFLDLSPSNYKVREDLQGRFFEDLTGTSGWGPSRGLENSFLIASEDSGGLLQEKNKENDNHDVPFYNRCFWYIRKSCVNTTKTVLGTPNGLPYYFQDKVQFFGLDFKAHLNLASAHFFRHHLPLSYFGKRMAPVSRVMFSCIQAIRSAWSALLYECLWNLAAPLQGLALPVGRTLSCLGVCYPCASPSPCISRLWAAWG